MEPQNNFSSFYRFVMRYVVELKDFL
jgi:hypothetical protein